MSVIPVILDPFLFQRLHHRRFYPKQKKHRRIVFVTYCLYFCTLTFEFSSGNSINIASNKKPSAWKTKRFRILSLIPLFSILALTVRYIDCCLYLGSVCYYYFSYEKPINNAFIEKVLALNKSISANHILPQTVLFCHHRCIFWLLFL